MADPHDNTRLAARLRSFADVVDPPAKGNGGMTPEDRAALPDIVCDSTLLMMLAL